MAVRPIGEWMYSCTVQALRVSRVRTALRVVEVQLYCTGTEALYRPYGLKCGKDLAVLYKH